eukprot:gene32523-9289_t
MSRPFGRHPNGFQGVMEVVRDWAMDANTAAPKADTGMVRLGVVQFAGSTKWASGDANQIVTSSGAGSSEGRLTGKWSEIDTDISYQQNNFMATSSALQPRKPPETTEATLDDKDNYAAVQTALAQKSVLVFGIAIRPFSTMSPVDERTQKDLLTIVSAPSSKHFVAARVDEIRVNALDTLCDPSRS